jgi:hypothetical protein
MAPRVGIVGIGHTRFGNSSEYDLADVMAYAATDALQDAGSLRSGRRSTRSSSRTWPRAGSATRPPSPPPSSARWTWNRCRRTHRERSGLRRERGEGRLHGRGLRHGRRRARGGRGSCVMSRLERDRHRRHHAAHRGRVQHGPHAAGFGGMFTVCIWRKYGLTERDLALIA